MACSEMAEWVELSSMNLISYYLEPRLSYMAKSYRLLSISLLLVDEMLLSTQFLKFKSEDIKKGSITSSEQETAGLTR